jgi:hypothetical protein
MERHKTARLVDEEVGRQAMTQPKSEPVRQPVDGKCSYCGSPIGYCEAGEYCTNDGCGYCDGHYFPRPKKALPSSNQAAHASDCQCACYYRGESDERSYQERLRAKNQAGLTAELLESFFNPYVSVGLPEHFWRTMAVNLNAALKAQGAPLDGNGREK